MYCRISMLLVAALMAFPAALQGQAPSGVVVGQVVDASTDRPLQGAQLQVVGIPATERKG